MKKIREVMELRNEILNETPLSSNELRDVYISHKSSNIIHRILLFDAIAKHPLTPIDILIELQEEKAFILPLCLNPSYPTKLIKQLDIGLLNKVIMHFCENKLLFAASLRRQIELRGKKQEENKKIMEQKKRKKLMQQIGKKKGMRYSQ